MPASPNPAADVTPEQRRLPAPVDRRAEVFRAVARHPEVMRFVRLVTRRDFPPCVLDDNILVDILWFISRHGVSEGARQFKANMSVKDLALMRAAARNCDRLKAQGVDLWAA